MAPSAQFGGVEANPGIPDVFDAPAIDIDSPHMYPGDIYQETSIPIEVRVSPFQTGKEFVGMYYSLDDGPNITLSMFTIEDYTAIFGEGTLDNLTEGNHTVKAFSTDTQGNTISSSPRTFLVNTTIKFPPFLLSPTNTAYYTKEIPLTYTIDESKYVVYNSIDKYSPYRINGNTTLAELSEGQHTITAIAYDLNGGIYSKQKAFFTIDTTFPAPPEISILTPLNQTYNDSSIPLVFTLHMLEKWSGYQVTWMGYSLDGQDNVTVTGNTTITGLPSGSHNITVYTENSFGNTGASETISFSVEVPFAAMLVPVASGASATIIAIGLLVYFKKRKH
jgi:hypothetical protein